MRARLESFEERQAAEAAGRAALEEQERAQAEALAQAIGDALIAEEQRNPTKKGGSEREKKGGKDKKR